MTLWGDVIEDYLEPLGLGLASFVDSYSGGWFWRYIEALHEADVETVLLCHSSSAHRHLRLRHGVTGRPIVVLPAPALLRLMRKQTRRYRRRRAEGHMTAHARERSWLEAVTPYAATSPRALAQVLRRERCEALLCQDYEHARFDIAVAVGRRIGLPVFATFQGGDWRNSRIERPVRPLTIRASAGLVIPTATEEERVRGRYQVPDERIARIFNPVDLGHWHARDRVAARRELGVGADECVVAWHGRVDVAIKGLDVLLDAWDRLTRERVGRRMLLLLIGTGPDAHVLRARIAVRPTQDVRWLDEFVSDRERLRRYLAAADVYAFPSRHEGFPVAPVEAMACGLPVVAAAADGVPDIFADGEHHGGLLVPTGDAGAFAQALGRLIDDLELRRSLGAQGIARCTQRFGYDRVGRQLRAFLLDRQRPTGA